MFPELLEMLEHLSSGDTDLTCARCGESLADAVDGELSALVDDQIRVATACPACDAALTIVESVMPEAMGVDVWVQDRRE